MTKKVYKSDYEGPREPFEFTLYGRDREGNEVTHDFTTLPEVQGVELTKIISLFRNGAEEAIVNAHELTEWIRACLDAPSVRRFDHITQGKDFIVPIDMLGELARDLIRHYSERPTNTPSDLPSGRSRVTPTSEGVAGGSTSPTPVPFVSVTSAMSSTR